MTPIESTLTVGDKTYTLSWRTNHICDMEKRVGMSTGQILNSITTVHIAVLSEFLFALLQPNHAKAFKSVEQVYDLIDEAGGYTGVLDPVTEMVGKMRRPKPEAEAQEGAAES